MHADSSWVGPFPPCYPMSRMKHMLVSPLPSFSWLDKAGVSNIWPVGQNWLTIGSSPGNWEALATWQQGGFVHAAAGHQGKVVAVAGWEILAHF